MWLGGELPVSGSGVGSLRARRVGDNMVDEGMTVICSKKVCMSNDGWVGVDAGVMRALMGSICTDSESRDTGFCKGQIMTLVWNSCGIARSG